MGSSVGNILKAAAPAIAGSLILGPAGLGLASAGVGGAIGGGAGGLIGGGGLKGTAMGALSGYGIGNLGSSLASAASGSGLLGAGAQTAAGDAAWNAALNGTGTFGAADAITSGGLAGGIASGFPSIYNLGTTLSNAGKSAANFFSPGTFASGASDLLTQGGAGGGGGAVDLSGLGNSSFAPSTALGAAQAAGGPSSTLGNFFNTGNTGAGGGIGAGGGSSSFGGLGLGSILSAASGIMNSSAISDAQKQLMAAQGQNQANNAPFLASGTAADKTLADQLGTSGNTGAANYGALATPYTPGDLSKDPGYQFQQQQGQLALDRSASAGGMLDSGAALKAAQQFGQGLAGTTYNNAFQRDLSTKQNNYNMLAGQTNVGVQAANNGVGINNAIGNIGASGTIAQNNNLTNTAANLAGRTVIGYDMNGKPIYS